MQFRDLDLNLLIVFHHMMEERKVSGVATRLGLTQPAVSNALSRLRRHFDDALFVRTARGMEPTTFALQLAEPIALALDTIDTAIRHRARFEPSSSRKALTIGMTDIGEIYFLPRLMEVLSTDAPGMTVSTVRDTARNLQTEMEAGRVDLAVGVLPQLQSGFFQRQLFTQNYVCMFRKGHPLDRQAPLSLDDFMAAEHAVVVAAETGHGAVDDILSRAGIRRHVRLRVPHFVAVGHILSATDLIATVPERFADCCVSPFGLTFTDHPARLPEIAVTLFWHATQHRNPENQWLRALICRLFCQAVPPNRRPEERGQFSLHEDKATAQRLETTIQPRS